MLLASLKSYGMLLHNKNNCMSLVSLFNRNWSPSLKTSGGITPSPGTFPCELLHIGHDLTEGGKITKGGFNHSLGPVSNAFIIDWDGLFNSWLKWLAQSCMMLLFSWSVPSNEKTGDTMFETGPCTDLSQRSLWCSVHWYIVITLAFVIHQLSFILQSSCWIVLCRHLRWLCFRVDCLSLSQSLKPTHLCFRRSVISEMFSSIQSWCLLCRCPRVSFGYLVNSVP